MDGPVRARPSPEKISVLIPARDAAATLGVQLWSLSRQRYAGDWEVVVADNGSTDGTAKVLREWKAAMPQLIVADASDQLGANYARNVAAAHATGDLLLFCDADDVTAAGWISAMAEASTRHDALGGRLEEETLNTRLGAGYRPPATPGDLPVGLQFLPYAVGSNCAVWRSVFDDVGGFDPEWQRGGTEVEFFWRVQLAGHTLGYAPDAVVHYRHRAGWRATLRQHRIWGISDVRLFAAFGHYGIHRESRRAMLRTWTGLMMAVPELGQGPERRIRWLCQVGYRIGRLQGCHRYRVLFL